MSSEIRPKIVDGEAVCPRSADCPRFQQTADRYGQSWCNVDGEKTLCLPHYRTRVAELEAVVAQIQPPNDVGDDCTAELAVRCAELEAERDQTQGLLDKFVPMVGENEIRALKAEAERDRLAAAAGLVVEWGEKYDYLMTEDAYQELTDICAALADSGEE